MRGPAGITTFTSSPTSCPRRLRASGEATEIRPTLMSASSGPTIWKVCSSSVSTLTELDLGAELDLAPAELGGIDHLGARERLLEEGDAGHDHALLVLGGVVLGVLLEVAVLARDANFLLHLRRIDLFEALELLAEPRLPLGCHRNLVGHGRGLSRVRAARGSSTAPRPSRRLSPSGDRLGPAGLPARASRLAPCGEAPMVASFGRFFLMRWSIFGLGLVMMGAACSSSGTTGSTGARAPRAAPRAGPAAV